MEDKKSEGYEELIKNWIEEEGFKYTSDDTSKNIIMESKNDKGLKLEFRIEDCVVKMQVKFPFRVECACVPLAAMYMAEYNFKDEVTKLVMDLDSGEIYLVDIFYNFKDSFNKLEMILKVGGILSEGEKIYRKLSHLAVGKTSRKTKNFYLAVFDSVTDMLKDYGNFDAEEGEEAGYGIAKIKKALGYGEKDTAIPIHIPNYSNSSAPPLPIFFPVRGERKDISEIFGKKSFLIEDESPMDVITSLNLEEEDDFDDTDLFGDY